MTKPRAILIAGPTASGKSALALDLAERLNGAVINADSMQVYRELRILTARPTPEDEARAPHLLYGCRPAAEGYSAGQWLDDAKRAIGEVRAAGRLPVVVGGTGLYFKALAGGLSPIPDIPANIRRYWREKGQTEEGGALHAELRQRDPVMAGRLRPSDPQRIIRALEVLEATGLSLAEWQARRGEPVLREEDAAKFFLAPGRGELYRRCNLRFEKMLKDGALDEAAQIMRLDLDPALPAIRAHGLRYLMAHLRGELTLDEAAERAKAETRQYAKRQFTWATRNMIAWIALNEQEYSKAHQYISQFMQAAY